MRYVKNNRKTTWQLSALFLLLSVSLTAFTSVQPVKADKTVITFWYTENDTEAPGVEALIEAFERQNPDVEVVAEQKGFFTAKNAYIVQYTAKQEPTVFRAARDWVVEFAYQGMILPVEQYFTEEDMQDFLPDALRLVTYYDENGAEHIYGFPQLVDSPALMYNKHYFEEAGINVTAITTDTSWTWDEFLAAAQALGSVDDEYGTLEYAFTFQGMFYGGQPAYYGHGAYFFEDGIVDRQHVAIDSEVSRSALQFIKSVVDADWTPSWDNQGWETINTYFSTGKVAMIQQGPWELLNFIQNAPEFNGDVDGAKDYACEDNLGIMRLPHDEQGHEGAPLGGHAYVITNRAQGAVLDAAVRFAKFMSSPSAMAQAAINYYHVPARASVFANETVQNSDAWKYISVFKEIVDRAYKVPVSHLWATLETIFAQELEAYLADEQSLDVMIERVKELWNEILPAGVTVIQTTSVYTSGTQVITATINITKTLPENSDEVTPFSLVAAILAPFAVIALTRKRKEKAT